MPTVDSSERDNKETLLVKEEVTNDAEVFGFLVFSLIRKIISRVFCIDLRLAVSVVDS